MALRALSIELKREPVYFNRRFSAALFFVVWLVSLVFVSNGAARAAEVPTELPTPSGRCPEFVRGDITVRPEGVRPRKVRIWIGPAAQERDGPLVFYWHGTGMSPGDANFSIGKNNIKEIINMGGVVAAPHADRAAQPYPWYIANDDTNEDDLLVADEVVACAINKVGIDVRRIHATGMSAGGLITSDMALRRSYYLASSSPHSGGIWCDPNYSRRSKHGGPPCPRDYPPDDLNGTASMIIHGGRSDHAGDLNFQKTSEDFGAIITANGGFALMCNHGRGHRVPMDAVDAVWWFFKAHPWGALPSPYVNTPPSGFPSYCSFKEHTSKAGRPSPVSGNQRQRKKR
jgi:predicted esterase